MIESQEVILYYKLDLHTFDNLKKCFKYSRKQSSFAVWAQTLFDGIPQKGNPHQISETKQMMQFLYLFGLQIP